MWACARGHLESASVLYQWNPSPLQVCNRAGVQPLTLARLHNHPDIVSHLESLELQRVTSQGQGEFSVCVQPSPPQHTTPSPTVTLQQPQSVTAPIKDGDFVVPRDLPPTSSHAHARSGITQLQDWLAFSSYHSNGAVNVTDLKIEIPSPPPYPGIARTTVAYQGVGVSKHSKKCDSTPASLQNTPKMRTGLDSVGDNSVRRTRLMKRTSVEVLPDYPMTDVIEAGVLEGPGGPVLGVGQCVRRGVIPPAPPAHRSASATLTSIHQDSAEPGLHDNQCVLGGDGSLLRSTSSDPHIPHLLTAPQPRGSYPCHADPMISAMTVRDLHSPLPLVGMEHLHHSYDTGLTLEDIQRETVAMETGSWPRI